MSPRKWAAHRQSILLDFVYLFTIELYNLFNTYVVVKTNIVHSGRRALKTVSLRKQLITTHDFLLTKTHQVIFKSLIQPGKTCSQFVGYKIEIITDSQFIYSTDYYPMKSKGIYWINGKWINNHISKGRGPKYSFFFFPSFLAALLLLLLNRNIRCNTHYSTFTID